MLDLFPSYADEDNTYDGTTYPLLCIAWKTEQPGSSTHFDSQTAAWLLIIYCSLLIFNKT